MRSGRNTIRIIDASELVSVTLSPARVSVECFRSVPLTVSGLMESGYEANLDNAEIEFEVVESEPEDAVQVSRDGIVTGVSKGTALIRAVVTIGSTTVESAPVEVNVVESMDKENVVVNFRSYQSGNARDATIDNDGWELDLSRSSPYVGGLPGLQIYGLWNTSTD